MVSNVPLAREEIARIASELNKKGEGEVAKRLLGVVGLLRRRKPARKMPVHSQPVTPEIREKVREMARTTDLHSAEIAVELNLNPGRVSEILNGNR